MTPSPGISRISLSSPSRIERSARDRAVSISAASAASPAFFTRPRSFFFPATTTASRARRVESRACDVTRIVSTSPRPTNAADRASKRARERVRPRPPRHRVAPTPVALVAARAGSASGKRAHAFVAIAVIAPRVASSGAKPSDDAAVFGASLSPDAMLAASLRRRAAAALVETPSSSARGGGETIARAFERAFDARASSRAPTSRSAPRVRPHRSRSFRSSSSSGRGEDARASEETTARTLLDANSKRFDPNMPRGVALRALLLSRSDDLRCVDVMCQWVGDACACRLARALDRRGESLKTLDVSGNALRALPSVVWGIQSLEVLNASDNALQPRDVPFDDLIKTPSEFAPSLRVLDLRGNVAIVDALGDSLRKVVDAMAARGVRLVL